MVVSCGEGPDCACYQDEKSRPPANPPQLAPKKITIEAGKSAYLCMCGQSKNLPYCDGAHKAYNEANGTKIVPHVVKNETDADKDYYACMCGHSKNRPFCDGSHAKVKDQ